jgi:hypothetical protein
MKLGLKAMLGLIALSIAACELDVGDGWGAPICIFEPSRPVESDNGVLDAEIECEEDALCVSDRRSLLRGTELKFRIWVPYRVASDELRVASTREEVLEVRFDKVTMRECGGDVLLHGTADFHGVGEAAVVVTGADGEIDRFTTTTYEADHLRLHFAHLFAGAQGEPIEALSIGAPVLLSVVVANEAGRTLVGGYGFAWELEDEDFATFDRTVVTRADTKVMVPVSIGNTVLRVRSSGLELEVPVEVTGVADVADGGTDAGDG